MKLGMRVLLVQTHDIDGRLKLKAEVKICRVQVKLDCVLCHLLKRNMSIIPTN